MPFTHVFISPYMYMFPTECSLLGRALWNLCCYCPVPGMGVLVPDMGIVVSFIGVVPFVLVTSCTSGDSNRRISRHTIAISGDSDRIRPVQQTRTIESIGPICGNKTLR